MKVKQEEPWTVQGRVTVDPLDEIDGALAVLYNMKLKADRPVFEGLAHQFYVGQVVLGEKNILGGINRIPHACSAHGSIISREPWRCFGARGPKKSGANPVASAEELERCKTTK